MDPSNGKSDPGRILPLEAWHRDLSAACEEIHRIGLEMVERHRSSGEAAGESADAYRLKECQDAERSALLNVLQLIGGICARLESAMADLAPGSLTDAARAIDENLPAIESDFMTARRAALDLLLWADREGRIDDSELPAAYRAAYARLVSYSPAFKPWLDGAHQTLLERVRNSDPEGPESALLAALSRLNALLEIARSFVRAIADPPMEIVFHETNVFLEDRESLTNEERRRLVSDLNDLCECLMYNRPAFERRTEPAALALPQDLETSLRVFPVESYRVLFAVDEDPLFGELNVTLYRVTSANGADAACAQIIDHLHRKLGNPPADS